MIIRPAGLLIRQNALLLMVYRYGGGVRYNLPGGKLDAGEGIESCLIREWQEELGLTIELGNLTMVAETVVAERQVLHLVFQVASMGEPCLNVRETSAVDLLWLPQEEWVNAPLYPAIGHRLAGSLARGGASCYLGQVEQPWLG